MTLAREEFLLNRLERIKEILLDETEEHRGCKDDIEAGVRKTDPDHGVPCRMCLWLVEEEK